MEFTNAGLKFRGRWKENCSFARSFEKTIDKFSSDKESVEEYDKWRPRENEDEEEITKRTAEEACIDRKKVEDDYNGAKEELEEAGEHIKNSVKGVVNGDGSSAGDIKEASKNVERLVEAGSIKSLRKLERMIYEKIMLRFNPYYFDTEEFSVSLQKANGVEKTYIFSINISDEELREEIRRELKKRTDN